MKNIALIGSTGSIGVQTLNVVRRNPDKFNIVSLAAGGNGDLLNKQVKEFSPAVASLSKPVEWATDFPSTEFFFGENAFTSAIVDNADIVVIALVGYKGIIAVLESIKKGKDIALANKESLVVGGELVMRLAKEKGVNIYPVDSEHSAIWQALSMDFEKPFNKLILTASGGAFRDFSKEQLKTVTAKDALKHPNWAMGSKITVDCASMVNKAFEVIEAKWLYKAPFDKIDVIIHRESIIHSMVEYLDGSVIAQMSYPSMEIPIALALSPDKRLPSNVNSLDFATIKNLTFSPLDKEKYPCFDLVVNAGKKGGCYPAVANGANDVAVNLFLQDKISFGDIYKAIDNALCHFKGECSCSFECFENANDYARRSVMELFNIK
jgi:1-deoxy-D-xylulose-5-phosphate reductoisomerase